MKLAVIGKDVSKSLSPEMHKFIAESSGRKVDYERLSVPEDKFEREIENLLNSYDGFNVTIPYKLAVMPYLNSKGDAEIFGAVNTVKCKEREGYNTDGEGFTLMLEINGVKVCGNKFLVLGAGGAGRSVAKKLKDGGAEVFIYDKNFENAKAVQNEFNITALRSVEPKEYYCIINATGVGMHNSEGKSPVGEDILKHISVAVDLIYTPPKSRFLEIAEKLNKKILNGEGMLFYQAYYSECIYFNTEPSAKEAEKLFKLYKEKMI